MKAINLFFFVSGIILMFMIPAYAKPAENFEFFITCYAEVLAIGMTIYFGVMLAKQDKTTRGKGFPIPK